MAMNKKEKQAMEVLKVKCALCWTRPIAPDIPKPADSHKDIVPGYVFNAYCLSVSESCSTSLYHSKDDSTRTTTQNPIEQYSTKLLALRAMRHEVELKCASRLREADVMIEQEISLSSD